MTWLTGYTYRKKITITGQAGAGTNYQVKLQIGNISGGDFNLGGHSLSFPNDIRFMNSTSSTQIDYWIEDIAASPITVWVEVVDSLNSNVDIYCYYGKAGDTTTSNGTNTFDLFDDFLGSTLDTSKWSLVRSQGSMSIASSIISMTTSTTQYNEEIHSLSTYSYSAIRYKAKYTTNKLGFIGYNNNTKQLGDGDIYATGIYAATGYPNGISVNGNDTSSESNFTLGIVHDVFRTFDIIRTSANSKYFDNGNLLSTLSSYQTSAPRNVIISARNAGAIDVDWILLRKYVSPEPTTCIGGEEVSTVSWLTGWNRRKPITITGSTSGAQTDYQMKVTVHKATGTDTSTDIYLGTNVNNDFSDLRFTLNDGSTLLSYWIESYTSGSLATVWAKIPSIPISPCTTTIYTYYNNASASNESNGVNTFIFFDDFQGNSLDTLKWTIVSGIEGTNFRVVNGNLEVYPGGIIRSNVPNQIGCIKEDRQRHSANPTNLAHPMYWVNLINTNDIGWYTAFGETGPTKTYTTKNGSETWHQHISVSDMTQTYIYKIIWTSSSVMFYQGNSLIDTISITSTIPVVNLYNYYGFDSAGSGTYYVDWTRVRKYASPEPTFGTIGTEQSVTATAMTIAPRESPCRVGICIVDISVTWTNSGESTIFTPTIIIDSTPHSLSPITLLTGDNIVVFSVSGLSVGNHAICPSPN